MSVPRLPASGGRAPAGAPIPAPGPARRGGATRRAGAVSLEMVLTLPLLALVLLALLQVVGVARDVLLVHEAARVGARAAATSTGPGPVRAAVGEVTDGVRVRVAPSDRSGGDLARVETTLTTGVGPLRRDVHATAVARVEPGVRP